MNCHKLSLCAKYFLLSEVLGLGRKVAILALSDIPYRWKKNGDEKWPIFGIREIL